MVIQSGGKTYTSYSSYVAATSKPSLGSSGGGGSATSPTPTAVQSSSTPADTRTELQKKMGVKLVGTSYGVDKPGEATAKLVSIGGFYGGKGASLGGAPVKSIQEIKAAEYKATQPIKPILSESLSRFLPRESILGQKQQIITDHPLLQTTYHAQKGSIAEAYGFEKKRRELYTYPITTRLIDISDRLQKGLETSIGYSEKSSVPVKAVAGFGSAFTGLPAFVGAMGLAGEAILRHPIHSAKSIPSGFKLMSSQIIQQAQTKPVEFIGSLAGMVAVGKIISVTSSKIPKLTKAESFGNLKIIKTPAGKEPVFLETSIKSKILPFEPTERLPALIKPQKPKVESIEFYGTQEGKVFARIPRSMIPETKPQVGGVVSGMAERISQRFKLPYTIGREAPTLTRLKLVGTEPIIENVPRLQAYNWDIDVKAGGIFRQPGKAPVKTYLLGSRVFQEISGLKENMLLTSARHGDFIPKVKTPETFTTLFRSTEEILKPPTPKTPSLISKAYFGIPLQKTLKMSPLLRIQTKAAEPKIKTLPQLKVMERISVLPGLIGLTTKQEVLKHAPKVEPKSKTESKILTRGVYGIQRIPRTQSDINIFAVPIFKSISKNVLIPSLEPKRLISVTPKPIPIYSDAPRVFAETIPAIKIRTQPSILEQFQTRTQGQMIAPLFLLPRKKVIKTTFDNQLFAFRKKKKGKRTTRSYILTTPTATLSQIRKGLLKL